jgi:hypothetical protein
MPSISRLVVLVKQLYRKTPITLRTRFRVVFWVIKRSFCLVHEQFHLRMDARARLPFGLLAAIGPIRAQNDFLRAASRFVLGFGAGGFSLLPVARL